MDNAPPVDTTGRPGGPAAAHRPRTAVRLPKFTGVTQLDQADQRDLQALIQALERRLGERVSSNESKQLLASHRRREEESLGVYAADVQLLTRRSYPEFNAATREALALHAFLRGLQPESLGQHVRLTAPQTFDAALDQAERAEVELCRRPDGASVDAAGAAAAPGTKNVEVRSRQRKGRVRTALPLPGPDLHVLCAGGGRCPSRVHG